MKHTSRSWLVDWIELMWQLLAINSHWQELINSVDEYVSEEEKEILNDMVIANNTMRRHLMQKIFDEFNWDHKYWCLLKHSVFAYELACELLYSDHSSEEFRAMQQQCSENMYTIISKFIWTDVVTCWRCLADSIDNEQDNNW